MQRVTVVLVALLSACGRGDEGLGPCSVVRGIAHCPTDGPRGPGDGPCDPLTQTACGVGRKCSWVIDAEEPEHVGHTQCVPDDGPADVGQGCFFHKPPYETHDSCKAGLVCSDMRAPWGTCKRICDLQGGEPGCGADEVCVRNGPIFSTGESTPPSAGVCERTCDPIADNDFDGSGSALTKAGTSCGSDPSVGCYGMPSGGIPPATSWSCRADLYAVSSAIREYRHRDTCAPPSMCKTQPNRCAQGYIPLLHETSDVSTLVCLALCKPMNCYAGNCGANNENRLGEAPHRCNSVDRVGSFDTSEGGEHCRYLWSFERDPATGGLLPSPTSDTVGICFDHSKMYNGAAPTPPCSSLPDGFGSGSALGAADLGCVDSTHAGGPIARRAGMFDDIRPLFSPPRTP